MKAPRDPPSGPIRARPVALVSQRHADMVEQHSELTSAHVYQQKQITNPINLQFLQSRCLLYTRRFPLCDLAVPFCLYVRDVPWDCVGEQIDKFYKVVAWYVRIAIRMLVGAFLLAGPNLIETI